MLVKANQLASGGRTSEAQKLASCVMHEAPDAAAVAYVHGCLCLKLSELEAAVASFERALSLDASDWRSALNLASSHLRLERGPDAVRAACRVTTLMPTFVAGHVVLASAHRLCGARAAALCAAREARRLHSLHAMQPLEAQGLEHELPGLLLGDLLVDDGHDDADLQEAWMLATEAANAATAALSQVQVTASCSGGGAGAGARGAVADAASAASAATIQQQMALACTLAGRVQQAAGAHEGAMAAYTKAIACRPTRAARPTRLRTALVTKALRSCLPACTGDIFVATFPKSGTTWMQQVACMLCGEPADVDLQMRAPYVEAALATGAFTLPALRALRTPRIFKTHAAWADLPVAGCTAHAPPPECRILVVVRDPRDVMVSLFYHSRSIKGIAYSGTWDEWFDAFVSGTAPLPMSVSGGGGVGGGGGDEQAASNGRCDWFEHVLGWWRVSQAHPRQVLLVRYEAMLAEPLEQVRKVARLVAPAAVEDVELLHRIVEASSFGEMKLRHEAHPENWTMRRPGEPGHFRKGVAGDWRGHLSPVQQERFAVLMAERLRGTGLEEAFPG